MNETHASPAAQPAPGLLVACLCAAWCGTCESYRPLLASLAERLPELAWAWVDIEDHSDALEAAGRGTPDIENFPTLMLLREGEPIFFGTVLPHLALLERLLKEAPHRPAIADRGTRKLAEAVAKLAAAGKVPL